MAWKISMKAFRLLNEEIVSFTSSEHGEFSLIEKFPGRPVRVKDIIFCHKVLNIWDHVVWGRVPALKGLDCHSFITYSCKRYDALNDFRVTLR